MKKILVLLILVPGFLTAQVEKGDKSMTYYASYIRNESFQFGLIGAKMGRYFTNFLEAGIKPQFMIGGGGDIDIYQTGLGLYAAYNFLTKDAKLLPYAGLEVSGNSFYISSSAFSTDSFKADLGLYGGAKYFFTERLNLDVSINYGFNLYNTTNFTQYVPVSATVTTEDPDYPDTFSINFGIGILINKTK